MANLDRLKQPDPRTRVILIGSLLLVALLIRLIDLNDGMWIDEILTYTQYARMPYLEIVKTFDSENQHFLYSILAHTSFLIFGESVWALRLPAVLFGVASIAALYRLGRDVTDEFEAIFSAALLTFSYHHVWFSQNGRGYTGLLFWALLGTWLFLWALRDKKLWIWGLYALTAALGVYTHITMIFMISGHLILFLIQTALRWKNWKSLHVRSSLWQISGFVLIGLFVLIFVSFLSPHFLNTLLRSEQLVKQAWMIPLHIVNEILKALNINPFSIGVLLLLSLISLIGMVSYLKTNPIVTGLFLLPILTSTAAAIILNHYIWPRYYFYLAGFVALFIVRGIVKVTEWLSKLPGLKHLEAYRLKAYGCIGLVLISAISVPFAFGPKQNYGGALAYIESNRRPGDEVAVVGFTIIPYTDYYKTNWTRIKSVDELEALRSTGQRVWIIYTLPNVLYSQAPDLMRKVDHDYPVIKQFQGTLEGGDITVRLQ